MFKPWTKFLKQRLEFSLPEVLLVLYQDWLDFFFFFCQHLTLLCFWCKFYILNIWNLLVLHSVTTNPISKITGNLFNCLLFLLDSSSWFHILCVLLEFQVVSSCFRPCDPWAEPRSKLFRRRIVCSVRRNFLVISLHWSVDFFFGSTLLLKL